MKILSDIVKDEAYHPAVRCNAMLAIGSLNEQEAEVGHSHAVPLSASLPILLNAVKNADDSDAVRVVALVGLVRHCRDEILSDPAPQCDQPNALDDRNEFRAAGRPLAKRARVDSDARRRSPRGTQASGPK